MCVCVCVCVYTHTTSFLSIPFDEHLSCFHVLAIVNSAIYTFNAIPIKLPNGIFHKTRAKHFKICMETQKTLLNSQSNPERGIQSWRNETPWLQIILQSYSNQNSMLLVQKQKFRSMEQEWKPRNLYTYGQLIYDKEGKNIKWRKDSLFNK